MPLYAFHFIIFTLTAGQRKTFLPPRLYALRQGVKLILEVCLVYVCLNLVLIPPGFGKLVAMGTDSPSRWCVMECDLFVPREITFVCVCVWGGYLLFFSILHCKVLCKYQKDRDNWFGSFDTRWLKA